MVIRRSAGNRTRSKPKALAPRASIAPMTRSTPGSLIVLAVQTRTVMMSLSLLLLDYFFLSASARSDSGFDHQRLALRFLGKEGNLLRRVVVVVVIVVVVV